MSKSNTKHDKSLLSLLPADYLGLAIFQITTVVLLVFAAVKIYINQNTKDIDPTLVLLVSALISSQLANARKLNKAAIQQVYSEASGKYDVSRIGTLLFYVVRPLFASLFAMLVYLLWCLSTDFALLKGELTTRLFTTVILIGIASGLYAGQLIERMEEKGVKLIEKATGDE